MPHRSRSASHSVQWLSTGGARSEVLDGSVQAVTRSARPISGNSESGGVGRLPVRWLLVPGRGAVDAVERIRADRGCLRLEQSRSVDGLDRNPNSRHVEHRKHCIHFSPSTLKQLESLACPDCLKVVGADGSCPGPRQPSRPPIPTLEARHKSIPGNPCRSTGA
jgi:hypothetical protein